MKKSSLQEERVKTGFTLIELLVVIAIIAILASILMPALSSARQRGKDSQCTGNLKNLAQAVQSYSDGNNDLFPMWYGHWESHWCYMLQFKKYFSAGSYNASNYKNLAYTVRDKQPQSLLNCPAAPEIDIAANNKYSGTHYAINEYTYIDARAASNLASSLKRGKAPGRHPSEHCMLVDSNRENSPKSSANAPYQWYANASTFRYIDGEAVTTTSETPITGALRHRGGMTSNVAFWDGHVEHVNPAAAKHKIKYYYANAGTMFFNPTK